MVVSVNLIIFYGFEPNLLLIFNAGLSFIKFFKIQHMK